MLGLVGTFYNSGFGTRCKPFKLTTLRETRDVGDLDISPSLAGLLGSCDKAKLFHPGRRSSDGQGTCSLVESQWFWG